MSKFSSVLRIQGAAKQYDDLASRFGRELCSTYKGGDPTGAEFSFAPINKWPGDVLIMAPKASPQSDIFEQINLICAKLEQNEDVLHAVLADGGSIEISCSHNSDKNIGDFRLSAAQIQSLSKFEVGVFFRFVIHDVFANE
jgi:hypothetical protein